MRTVTSELNNSKDILNSPTILSKTFHPLFLQLQIHIHAGAMMPKTGLKILLRMGKWLLWSNNCLWDPGDYQTTPLSHTFDFFMKKIMSFPLLLLSLHSCRRPFLLSISHPCRARSHLWLYTSSFPHTCAERVSSLHLIFHKTAVPHTRFL